MIHNVPNLPLVGRSPLGLLIVLAIGIVLAGLAGVWTARIERRALVSSPRPSRIPESEPETARQAA